MENKKRSLTRDTDNKMLSGVLAGVAKKYNLNLEILRVSYALITFFFAVFPGIAVYVIMAIIMPKETEENIVINNKKSDDL